VLTPSTPWLRKGGSLSETKTTDEAKLVSTGLTERSERHGAEGGPSMIPPLKGAQGDVFGARQKVEGRRQNRRRIFHCTCK
jgi:hypothetical protein